MYLQVHYLVHKCGTSRRGTLYIWMWHSGFNRWVFTFSWTHIHLESVPVSCILLAPCLNARCALSLYTKRSHQGRVCPILYTWRLPHGRVCPILYTWRLPHGRVCPILYTKRSHQGRVCPILYTWRLPHGRVYLILYTQRLSLILHTCQSSNLSSIWLDFYKSINVLLVNVCRTPKLPPLESPPTFTAQSSNTSTSPSSSTSEQCRMTPVETTEIEKN